MDKFYYFGYGSNMDAVQMKRRCSDSKAIGVAELKNHKLIERKFADIEYCEGSIVYGVLYEISEDDLTALDYYEGYPDGYVRKEVYVDCDGQIYKAIVYEMTLDYREFNEGIPYSDDYLKLCHNAAQYWKLPVNEYE